MVRTRYRAAFDRIKVSDLPAGAMRAVWREGCTRVDLRADVLAGLVVGIVALPLAMALAIAVEGDAAVWPRHLDRRWRRGRGAWGLAAGGGIQFA